MNFFGCLWLHSLVFLGSLTIPIPVFAQLLPDASLGNESSIVTPDINQNLPINRVDGGAIRNSNLFHSFQEFNIPADRGVYFSIPDNPGIDRIITRVTGGNSSQLLGTLGTLGNASVDLFLINPHGIFFGENAQLDLNGSFIGSTVESINFGNGIEFSATNPQPLPLLTINLPIGLQHGTNPGSIEVHQAQLEVEEGQSLALVGGKVTMMGGALTASEGRIELGSVGNNEFISLTPMSNGWTLGNEGVNNFQDLHLTDTASIQTSGERGGEIQLFGRNILLDRASNIVSNTTGSQNGGTLAITASESLKVMGNFAFLQTSTSGSGRGGDVRIETGEFLIQDGGFLFSNTAGEGQGGNIAILARESVQLIGVDLGNGLGGLYVQAGSNSQATAKGGNITIETNRLTIQDGAVIDTGVFDAGNAGDVTIQATELVTIRGSHPNPNTASGIAAPVNDGATGDAGDIFIETRQLILEDGGQIQAETRGAGNAGILQIYASELIRLSGVSLVDNSIQTGLFVSSSQGNNSVESGNGGELGIVTGRLTVADDAIISARTGTDKLGGNITIEANQLVVSNGGEILAGSTGTGDAGFVNITVSDLVEVTGVSSRSERISSISTSATDAGNAGDLQITTGLLRVSNQGEITVGSTGDGDAGSLDITANNINLVHEGKLSADATAGLGNITLQVAENTILRNNSRISTNSQGSDPGGNITITTDNLVALENSDITANATNSSGGQVKIEAVGVFGTEFRDEETDKSDITATSELGAEFSGVVDITTPDVDPSSGLVTLPETVVNVEGLIAQNACAGDSGVGSSFTIAGRGGLPANPNDTLSMATILADWVQVENETVSREREVRLETSENSKIREAQGWVQLPNGKIVLTAEAPRVTANEVTGEMLMGCSSSRVQNN